MRKILFLAILLISGTANAQVQSEAISVGSNLTGIACRVNEGQTALASESEANFCTTDTKGNLQTSLQAGTASASNPIKLEDAASTSGDAGIGIFGIRNDTAAALTGTNADYGFPVVNQYGGVVADLDIRFQGNGTSTRSPIRAEDDAAVSGDAGVVVMGMYRSSTAQGAGTAGDYTTLNTDADGRMYVNPYGAGMGEWFQSCGTATAVTSDVAIKAAVASNRMYVTSITCKNTSATVGTTLDFKDGATVIATGGISSVQATAPGSFTATFPTPLRGSVNTALNFATNVAVTSATCCAQGFISTN